MTKCVSSGVNYIIMPNRKWGCNTWLEGDADFLLFPKRTAHCLPKSHTVYQCLWFKMHCSMWVHYLNFNKILILHTAMHNDGRYILKCRLLYHTCKVHLILHIGHFSAIWCFSSTIYIYIFFMVYITQFPILICILLFWVLYWLLRFK